MHSKKVIPSLRRLYLKIDDVAREPLLITHLTMYDLPQSQILNSEPLPTKNQWVGGLDRPQKQTLNPIAIAKSIMFCIRSRHRKAHQRKRRKSWILENLNRHRRRHPSRIKNGTICSWKRRFATITFFLCRNYRDIVRAYKQNDTL